MADNMFAKFNEMFGGESGLAGLKQDIESAASQNTNVERVKVPCGDYEVAIAKIELGENTYEESKDKGCPQINVWFKVIAGEFKGQLIFWTTNISGQYAGFKLNKMREFFDSLETGIPVVFENFEQYAELLKQIFDAVDGTAEYQLSYAENSKGFKEYTIVQRF